MQNSKKLWSEVENKGQDSQSDKEMVSKSDELRIVPG